MCFNFMRAPVPSMGRSMKFLCNPHYSLCMPFMCICSHSSTKCFHYFMVSATCMCLNSPFITVFHESSTLDMNMNWSQAIIYYDCQQIIHWNITSTLPLMLNHIFFFHFRSKTTVHSDMQRRTRSPRPMPFGSSENKTLYDKKKNHIFSVTGRKLRTVISQIANAHTCINT